MCVFTRVDGTAEVKYIERRHEDMKEAVVGDMIGINVKSVVKDTLRRGYVCGDPFNDPPAEAEMFVAQIVVTSHPNGIHVVIKTSVLVFK